jgi:hypothetical protein
MITGSFPGVKQPGLGVDHPLTSSAEVKERLELYLYFLLWAFADCSRVNFTFTFTITPPRVADEEDSLQFGEVVETAV